jgi:hypothetical protein
VNTDLVCSSSEGITSYNAGIPVITLSLKRRLTFFAIFMYTIQSQLEGNRLDWFITLYSSSMKQSSVLQFLKKCAMHVVELDEDSLLWKLPVDLANVFFPYCP